MSFGRYEYQHRFFQNTRPKKASLHPNTYNNIFPHINNYNPPYAQITTYPNSPIINSVNLATRAGPIRPNEPGWDAYRLKSYVTEQYSQDYQQNAQTLERFRREAQEYRKRKRFGSLDYRYNVSRNDLSPINEIYQDLEENKAKIQSLKQSIVQNPLLNPEIYRYHYQNDLRARLQRYENQRSNMISRLQVNEHFSRRKMEGYKKKYSKLKEKLKQEIIQRQKQQMENLHRKEKVAIQKTANKLEDIQKMLSSISTGLQQNSEIFSQSLKLQSQMKMKNSSSSFAKNNSKLKNQQQASNRKLLEQQNEVVSEQQQQDNKLPRLTPKIIYTQKRLQSQYKQLQNMKKYIQTIETRIKKLKTQ